ncbi:6-phosphogluconate phosphatase [Sinobacterium norvegicum]|uniref:6-phosphogluconate phosphatase n=1 Tax=Sinobacterium norvegicum TaxID=1641715 RepID=A0ABN8EPM5_9GAMM|nr:HAD family hydrolase [Sinobacterium norvegicum]CAH0993324.1 6-phosphogluconate phosphatase [Sinobacterium norvegicum]
MVDFNRVALIIFDCDGVLVDSEGIAARVMAEHVTALGWPMTLLQCQQAFKGLSLARCGVLIEKQLSITLPDTFFSDLQRQTFACFSEELTAITGVEALLQSLRIPCCVASSGYFDKLAVTLEKTSLAGYFDQRVYSAEQVANGKPAPDLFLFAAAQMQVDAERCLVVEDSLPGVEAALAAGMQVIGYDEVGTGELSVKASEVVQTMAQLQQRLATAGLVQQ